MVNTKDLSGIRISMQYFAEKDDEKKPDEEKPKDEQKEETPAIPDPSVRSIFSIFNIPKCGFIQNFILQNATCCDKINVAKHNRGCIMKRLTKILVALMMSTLIFSSCAADYTTSDVSKADNSVAKTLLPAGTSETKKVTEEVNEETYMERCKNIMVEMPPDEILEEHEDIVYPTFQKYTYYSRTAERDTPVNVLLPADYSEDKEYPVLYILHGYWDNEDWMTRDVVHISTMLTNLILDGKAQEMIVVCPYIYCSKDMPYCTGMDTQNTLNYDNFINDMTTDLMPFIEEKFSVATGRKNTAITGFSMGGRESLYIGVTEADRFGYVGAVCAAPGLTEGTGYPFMLTENQLKFNENKPELLLLSAAQNDGVVGANPATYRDIFLNNGEELIWHSMSTTGHDASSVTPHLYNYLRMIFQS